MVKNKTQKEIIWQICHFPNVMQSIISLGKKENHRNAKKQKSDGRLKMSRILLLKIQNLQSQSNL